MTAQTARSTINLKDGTQYRVRTHDRLATLAGPVRLYERTPGEWFENDGPTLAWFVLTPHGWLHKESGRTNKDSVYLSLDILKSAA